MNHKYLVFAASFFFVTILTLVFTPNIQPVEAAVTAYTLPTANTNSGCTEPTTGLYTDQNPPTVTGDLYLCDSDNSPNVEDYERFSGFDFGLTPGVEIQGIAVHLNDVSLTLTGSGTQTLKVRLSWDGGTSWTSAGQTDSTVCATPDITSSSFNGPEYYCINTSSTATTTNPTTSAGLWGHAWTTSDLSSSNFVIQVTADNTSGTARVQRFDIVEAKVFYAPTFIQNHYRWYVNSGSQDVTDPWFVTSDIAEDTAISIIYYQDQPVTPNTELRLRVNLTVGTINLPANDQSFKLQYKKGTDGSCTTGSWSDVGDSPGGSEEWTYATSAISHGTTLTSAKLTGTNVLEQYIKSYASNTNPNSATTAQDVEYDFHILHNRAASNSTYSFRVVYVTNSADLSSYSTCPTLTTAPGAGSILRHGKFFSEDGTQYGMFWAR